MSGQTSAAEVLDELVARSRLIGSEEDLVVHGGGNTSTKVMETDDHVANPSAAVLGPADVVSVVPVRLTVNQVGGIGYRALEQVPVVGSSPARPAEKRSYPWLLCARS